MLAYRNLFFDNYRYSVISN